MTPPGLALVALTLSPLFLQAAPQAKPDFSGRWTIVGAPRGGAAALGWGFQATQDDKTLTIVSGNDPDLVTTLYELSGVPTMRQARPVVAGTLSMQNLSSANWDGAKLVVMTRQIGVDQRTVKVLAGESGVLTTQAWSLDAAGTLVIETSTSFGDKVSRTSTTTYRKFR